MGSLCFRTKEQNKSQRQSKRFIKLAFVFIGKVLQSVEADVHVSGRNCIEKVAQKFFVTSLKKDKKVCLVFGEWAHKIDGGISDEYLKNRINH